MAKSHFRFTGMSLAFVDAAVKANGSGGRAKRSIIRAAEKESGRVREQDWNAKLSFRTAKYLKEVGVLV